METRVWYMQALNWYIARVLKFRHILIEQDANRTKFSFHKGQYSTYVLGQIITFDTEVINLNCLHKVPRH